MIFTTCPNSVQNHFTEVKLSFCRYLPSLSPPSYRARLLRIVLWFYVRNDLSADSVLSPHLRLVSGGQAPFTSLGGFETSLAMDVRKAGDLSLTQQKMARVLNSFNPWGVKEGAQQSRGWEGSFNGLLFTSIFLKNLWALPTISHFDHFKVQHGPNLETNFLVKAMVVRSWPDGATLLPEVLFVCYSPV